MFDYRRTHTCGELNLSDTGKTILLSGWVHRHRDLGGLTFIDLRDRFGLTQVVFDPTKKPELQALVAKLRSEWVVSIRGTVTPRASGMANSRLSTGEIEILLEEVEILSPAKTPPFVIADDKTEIGEDLRLKYRYLDIRRGVIAQNLILRHNLMRHTREFLHTEGFLEITTPILGKSTPEGARDYLVPSRVYPGNFYALPQSPQIFKQLLMVSGMDRYFQIAPCFRDEDLRADRQPEFTQIDMEISFGMPEDLMTLIENLLAKLFKECNNITIPLPFMRMSYKDCVEHYGCDRPDLRFGMPLVRLDTVAEKSTFTVFLNELEAGGCVKALCVKKGATASRKEIENFASFVQKFGLKGLAWIKKQKEGMTSSIAKFFSPEQMEQIFSLMEAEEGDLILIGAGPEERVNQGLDHLRRHIGKEKGWMDPHVLKFLWVTDFPLLRWNEEEKRMESEHHPFTAPHPEDLPLLDSDPLKVRALAYDIVLNGYEIGGGSQRIHNSLLQEKIFQTLNLSEEEISQKFGFFVEALKYGTPPHLGIALGLDRLVMLLAKTDNIRDVIAFPKTQRASDLMMQAPSTIHPRQLKELEIQTTPTEISWI